MSAGPLSRPDGPSGLPLVGVLPEFYQNPAEFLLNIAREYGDVSYFRLGWQRVYFFNRPDLIEEVLVAGAGAFSKSRMLQRARAVLGDGLLTAHGSAHARQRKLVQPAFYQDRLRSYADTMVRCAGEHASRWKSGAEINMAEEMMRLTLRVIGLTLFSRDVEGDAAGIGKALTDLIGTFDFMLMPGAGVLRHLPFPVMVRARRARKYMDSVVDQMTCERGSSGEDLLATLRHASHSGGITPAQVRDHVVTLLLAGHETTATALTWTWYLLSQNPDVDARMRGEIEGVLGTRPPTFDDVERLEYTERVFAEALRLYPPAWALGRMAVRETRIFNYLLPKGSIVILSPYTMHRHARYWPEPERFDPDRFLPENIAARPRFSFFPFGGGPRACIGERFAWNEGVLVLATLAQRWRPVLAPGQRVATHPRITLRPRFGMRMVLE